MKLYAKRIKFILLSITLVLTAIMGYTFYFNITKGEAYEQKALRQYTNRYDTEMYAMRGSIVDRNMKELAVSIPVYNLILDPYVLYYNSPIEKIRVEMISKVKSELNRILDIPTEKIDEYLMTDANGELLETSRYIQLVKGISRADADTIRELALRGVRLEDSSTREYPYNELASNVLGFVRGDAYWGIENYYNDMLTGEPGRSFVTYADTKSPENVEIPAKNGHKVVTTLDSSLQGYAEEALKNAVEAYKPDDGAIIVLKPDTGEVLAMAMYPSFNPNDPMTPIYMDDSSFAASWELKTDEEKMEELNREWKNYCITSIFEPGSIFKPIVVAAALDEGIIDLESTFYCGGFKMIYDERIGCHHAPGHGVQTVEQVLANSCNVAMMDIGAKMGPELFYKHFRAFGFGERTEIDLPGEESAQNYVYGKKNFENPVDLATSSFGQGSTCTAIQAINSFAAVINGGNVMKPYVVSQIIDEAGNVVLSNKPTVMRKILSTETSDILRVMMRSVVDEGTGKKAKIPGYSIGGKTGTAEQGKRDKTRHTLTFIGYLPVENPEIVAIALLNNPEDDSSQGSATAAPMLKEFLEDAIQHLGIRPSNEEEVSADSFLAADYVMVPNFEGASMAEATEMLIASGLKYEESGGGNIVAGHWPRSGTKVDRGTTVTVYTKLDETAQITHAVPDVTGKAYDEALSILLDSDFGVVVNVENTEGKVVLSQEPLGGHHAPKGADVTLTLSTAAEAVETTEPLPDN